MVIGEVGLRGAMKLVLDLCKRGGNRSGSRRWVVLRELWTFDASRHGVRSCLGERGGVWFKERF